MPKHRDIFRFLRLHQLSQSYFGIGEEELKYKIENLRILDLIPFRNYSRPGSLDVIPYRSNSQFCFRYYCPLSAVLVTRLLTSY